MFFWKFTRSGFYSKEYISLVIDFHNSTIENNIIKTTFEECKDIMILFHDVEKINEYNNKTAGLEKQSFQDPVNELGFKASSLYDEQRNDFKLVFGKMQLGTHEGSPLDYGMSNKKGTPVGLNKCNLEVIKKINAKTGKLYGDEDKLKAYRDLTGFINKGYYFDLMPKHICMIEIVNQMMICDLDRTTDFLTNILKWEKL